MLTSADAGLSFTESCSSGTLFTAVHVNEKKGVISATTGSGSASGAFVALGDVNHTVHVNGPILNLSVEIAQVLMVWLSRRITRARRCDASYGNYYLWRSEANEKPGEKTKNDSNGFYEANLDGSGKLLGNKYDARY